MQKKWQSGIAWLVVFLISAFVLARLDYYTRDGDSVLYADIASNLAAKPLMQWIAPVWVGGLFREHPAGIFSLPALLASFGYPAQQAAYVVNSVYQILSLLLFARIALFFVEGFESRSLTWMLQLIPLAFVFRIRANHEQAILMFLLLAVYALIKIERSVVWGVIVCFALAAILLIKGMFVVFAILTCIAWIVILKLFDKDSLNRTHRAVFALLASIAFMVLVAYFYDVLYKRATGQPFLSFYLGRQLRPAAVEIPETNPLIQMIYNFFWYARNLIWYPFPWSLFFIWMCLHSVVTKKMAFVKDRRMIVAGVLLTLAVVLIYAGAFSFFYRRAGRYIFPAYYFLAAGGALTAIRSNRWVREASQKVDILQPWFSPALWLLLFGLHILNGRFH